MRIGINFPTNLGDTILAFPVLDLLRENYPRAQITAISSLKTEKLLERNNFIDKVILFDKSWNWRKKMKFSFSLRGSFDIFVDLKNSFLPLFLRPKEATSFLRFSSKNIHKRLFYLNLIRKLVKEDEVTLRSKIVLASEEKERWMRIFQGRDYLFIGGKSSSSLKSYPLEFLKEVVKKLKNRFKIVLLGRKEDANFYGALLKEEVINLIGKTSIEDVFFLLENYARALLSVDCSLLHIGSYLNIPVVALFGPTSEKVFGPYSEKSLSLTRKDLNCRPCGKSFCRFKNNECMKIIPQEVVEAILKISKLNEEKA